MERIIEEAQGQKLYECNPELNTQCDKRICMHNVNAVERLCHGTFKKECALMIGQTAEVKEYTPPV